MEEFKANIKKQQDLSDTLNDEVTSNAEANIKKTFLCKERQLTKQINAEVHNINAETMRLKKFTDLADIQENKEDKEFFTRKAEKSESLIKKSNANINTIHQEYETQTDLSEQSLTHVNIIKDNPFSIN